MNNKRNLITAAALSVALASAALPQAHAEQLTIPVGSQADRSQETLPANGMTQDSVRSRWGSPADMRGPVGEPPISQWHYQDFVVYFENDRVLHAVMKRRK
jgi:hypothetical protein